MFFFVNEATANPIILYDGVCGLCDRFVAMVLRKDKRDQFRFASLQSAFAQAILRRHSLEQPALETICLVLDYETPQERLLTRSDAVIAVLRQLGGLWIAEAAIFRMVPRTLRDRLYDAVARNRYRYFGRYDQCMVPHPRYREKFLE